MNSFAVRVSLSLLLVAVGVYGTYTGMRLLQLSSRQDVVAEDPAPRKPPRPLSEFSFTERSGEEVSFKKLEGRVWVASFFFASCPGFCKQMNHVIATLQHEFPAVQFVSITVDPRNDTPEVLAEYAKQFSADPDRWLFLSGPFADTRELGQDVFQVTVVPKDHSDRLILVDRHGKVRGTYRATVPAQVELLKKELKKVLDEGDRPERAAGASEPPNEKPGENSDAGAAKAEAKP